MALDVLAQHPDPDDWLSIEELTAEMQVPGSALTRARTESVRRAVKALAERGLVDLELQAAPRRVAASRVDRGDGYAYRDRHVADRAVLCAHWPLSVEEKRRRGVWLRAWLDRLAALDERTGS